MTAACIPLRCTGRWVSFVCHKVTGMASTNCSRQATCARMHPGTSGPPCKWASGDSTGADSTSGLTCFSACDLRSTCSGASARTTMEHGSYVAVLQHYRSQSTPPTSTAAFRCGLTLRVTVSVTVSKHTRQCAAETL